MSATKPLKQELVKGLRFFLILCLVGGLIFLTVSFFMDLLIELTVSLSVLFLGFFGINAEASSPFILGVFSKKVEIIPLCVGDFEIAVLLGAIAATEDRKIRERLMGMIGGAFFVFLVNPLRISLTLGTGVWWGIQTMDFVHSLLFRAVLLLVIIGFYVLWYIGPQVLGNKFKKN